MEEIAHEFDDVGDLFNFQSDEGCIKFLQNDTELFYKIEEVTDDDEGTDEQNDRGTGEETDDIDDALDEFINSLNESQLKELDKQVVDIGGNKIRFATLIFLQVSIK